MAASAISPIAYRRGEGETFWSFGALVTVKASAATTGGRVAVFDLFAEKGSALRCMFITTKTSGSTSPKES